MPRSNARVYHQMERLARQCNARVVRQMERLMIDSRRLLAGLAEFVAQAGEDEQRHVSDPRLSLTADIGRLEEEGLYHLLCKLQIEFVRRGLAWQEGERPRSQSAASCRTHTTDRAAIDNRNYMVFYTLDSVLRHLADRFWSLEAPQSAGPAQAAQPAARWT